MPTWSLPHLDSPQALWGLVLVPGLWFLWWYSNRQRHEVLRHWSDSMTHLSTRRWLGHFLLIQIVVLLVLAVAGPEWGSTSITPTTSARDLFLVFDISQSMLAEDKPPFSRLSRARQAARQLLVRLQKPQTPTRVGIIAFAGNSRLICPPTEDLEHVQQVLLDLNTESLGMTGRTIDIEGTPVGTSLAAAAGMLADWFRHNTEFREFTDCVILTDGDDLTSSVEMEAFLGLGLPIHVLALGDPLRDWPIPLGNSYLMATDAATGTSTRALTRRRDDKLRELTVSTRGTFMLEEAGPEPLVVWWQREVVGQPARRLQSQARTTPINRADWLLSIAGLFLLAEIACGGVRQREW